LGVVQKRLCTFTTEITGQRKRNYTLNCKRAHGFSTPLKLWQARFWDHVIRDGRDLERHFDYIHDNPVKHGCVKWPEDWGESTYSH